METLELPDGTQAACVYATGFWRRLRGLLGTRPSPGHPCPTVLAIPNCGSIHTVGMAYPIDVAFADEGGRIMAVKRSVKPCRVFSALGASCALEREASTASWFEVGDVLRFM